MVYNKTENNMKKYYALKLKDGNYITASSFPAFQELPYIYVSKVEAGQKAKWFNAEVKEVFPTHALIRDEIPYWYFLSIEDYKKAEPLMTLDDNDELVSIDILDCKYLFINVGIRYDGQEFDFKNVYRVPLNKDFNEFVEELIKNFYDEDCDIEDGEYQFNSGFIVFLNNMKEISKQEYKTVRKVFQY